MDGYGHGLVCDGSRTRCVVMRVIGKRFVMGAIGTRRVMG